MYILFYIGEVPNGMWEYGRPCMSTQRTWQEFESIEKIEDFMKENPHNAYMGFIQTQELTPRQDDEV